MNNVNQIEAQDTIPIRHRVLREGKPVESCIFDDDYCDESLHFGIAVNKKNVAVVSMFKNKNTIFNAENQWQIRGMAVLPNYQKKGFGKQLILECERVIPKELDAIIWLNARENAVVFYEKMGYKKTGSAFTIDKIGIHFIMYKKIYEAYG